MPRILFLCGSLRRESSSMATVRALRALLEGEAETPVETDLADIRSLPHYDADIDGGAPVEALKAAIAAADGLVFVTPEYNYSIPGVLKNAIDWASRPAMESVFKGKPCLVVSTSGGAMGGVRAQSHLKYVLNGMLARLHAVPEIVIPHAPKKVEDGVLTDGAVLDFVRPHLASFVEGIRPRA